MNTFKYVIHWHLAMSSSQRFPLSSVALAETIQKCAFGWYAHPRHKRATWYFGSIMGCSFLYIFQVPFCFVVPTGPACHVSAHIYILTKKTDDKGGGIIAIKQTINQKIYRPDIHSKRIPGKHWNICVTTWITRCNVNIHKGKLYVFYEL